MSFVIYISVDTKAKATTAINISIIKPPMT